MASNIANLSHGQRADYLADRSIDLSAKSLDTKETISHPVSQSQAAEMLNVSVPSVQRAVKVREHGVPELKKAVEQAGYIKQMDQLIYLMTAANIANDGTGGHIKSKVQICTLDSDEKERDLLHQRVKIHQLMYLITKNLSLLRLLVFRVSSCENA